MRYMDASFPHHHVWQVYLNGQFIPNAAAADSDSGWVDVIVMIDGQTQYDSTGRPVLVRQYGEVQTYTIEGEQMETLLSFIAA
jgi:hypothetical protein